MNKRGLLKYIKRFFRMFFSVLSSLSIFVLIIIGGFLVYYFVSIKIYEYKGEQYKPFISLYTIISPSMEPNVKVYDVIIDKRVSDISEIEIGDVITFISSSIQSQGLTVTHRVSGVVINPDGVAFKTKGDNNAIEDDGLVYQNQLIGKVVFKFPQLGRIQLLLASKGGWFIIVLLPALGIIVYDIIKLCKLIVLKDQIDVEKTKAYQRQISIDADLRRRKEQERLRKEKLAQRFMK